MKKLMITGLFVSAMLLVINVPAQIAPTVYSTPTLSILYPGIQPSGTGSVLHPGEMVPLSDSLHSSSWDTVSSAFVLKSRYFNTYDGGGLLLETINKTLDKSGTNWQNYSQMLYSYAGPKLSQELYQQWNLQAAEWRNIWKKQYTYNDQNLVSEIMLLIYSTNAEAWVFSSKYGYTYNTNQQVTKLEVQTYNVNLNLWVNSERYTSTYNGTLLQSSLFETWNTNSQEWQPYARTTFTFTGNNPTQSITERFDSGSSTWYNYTKDDYTYVGSSRLTETETHSTWNGTQWINADKYLNTYENELLKTRTKQSWIQHLAAWRNQNLEETYYSMHDVQGIAESSISFSIIPNPAKAGGQYRITCPEPVSVYRMYLSDGSGKIVATWDAGNGAIITLPSTLVPGIYILRATKNNDPTVFQKLFIIR